MIKNYQESYIKLLRVASIKKKRGNENVTPDVVAVQCNFDYANT